MHITRERLRVGDGSRPRRKSMRSLKLERKVKTASNNMSHGIYASSVPYTDNMEYRRQGSSTTFSTFQVLTFPFLLVFTDSHKTLI